MTGPVTQLLQSRAALRSNNRVLIVNTDDEQFVTWVAAQAGEVTFFHRSQQVRDSIAPAPNLTVATTVFPQQDSDYDRAFVHIPKGRDFARAILFTALAALKPGGLLFAAGFNGGGAKTAQTDIAHFGPAPTRANKSRHRLFSIQRPDVLHPPVEWGRPWERQTRTFTIHEHDYTVVTRPGVFSWDHLDDGTALLLDHLPDLPPGLRLLDAGCGYGIIGMVAAHELAAESVVYADDDLLAVDCVRATQPTAIVLNADLTRDRLPDHAPFDLILCNPPFHRDHIAETSFMRQFADIATDMLNPAGRLVIVANSFLPYRDLLAVNFTAVDQVVDDGRFQVLEAVR